MMGRKDRVNSKGEITISPITVFDYKKFNEGTIHHTTNGDYFIILEYVDGEHVRVKFLDNFGYETWTYKNQIVKGNVWNPYRILYHGGYIGVGKFVRKYNVRLYKSWENMLERANARISKDYMSYLNCTVCPEWLCLQNFGAWYENYLSMLNPKYYDVLEIDKDIKQWNMPNKVYSPYTCCLVPPEINILLNRLEVTDKKYHLPVGVRQDSANSYRFTVINGARNKNITKYGYKTAEEAFEGYKIEKKNRITTLANFYYNDGGILEDVYDILCNIEILPYPIQ